MLDLPRKEIRFRRGERPRSHDLRGINLEISGGERGIRTPGGLHLNGFQDRRNRPLCHLSVALKLLQNLTFPRSLFNNENARRSTKRLIAKGAFDRMREPFGGVSKWLKGADCKSVQVTVRGFESLPHHHFRSRGFSRERFFCFVPAEIRVPAAALGV